MLLAFHAFKNSSSCTYLLTLMSHNPCHEISSLDVFKPYSPIILTFLRPILIVVGPPCSTAGLAVGVSPLKNEARPIPVFAPPIFNAFAGNSTTLVLQHVCTGVIHNWYIARVLIYPWCLYQWMWLPLQQEMVEI